MGYDTAILVNDTTFASDSPLRFRQILEMIRDELKYDINREAVLSSGKTDKYEYLPCDKILPSDQSRMIEQAKFTYCQLGIALEKQNMYKSNLNEIVSGRSKSKDQENALENMKLLWEAQEAVIKLFINYSRILAKAKYKTIHVKGSLLGLETCLKILTPKQTFQRSEGSCTSKRR